MADKCDKADFNTVLDYIASTIGIILPDTNYKLLENFLRERLELFDIGINEYLRKIENDIEEHIFFIDTITINETYFFREEKHFDILKSSVFPEIKKKETYPVRIWSLACSTGEEAISLYLAAKEYFRSNGLFSVFASDVNRNVLRSFEAGLYKKNSFRDDGRKYHGLIDAISERDEKYFKINKAVLDNIKKKCINLKNIKNEKIEENFDLVFLRNALIYFNIDKRSVIVGELVDKINEEGFLFLSSSEVPFISNPKLVLREINGSYFFQKKSNINKKEFDFITPPLIEEIKKHEDKKEVNRRFIKKADLNMTLNFAYQKLNNKLFNLPLNREYELSLILIEIIYFLNNNEFQNAQDFLKQFEEASGRNEVFYYISGYMFMMKDDDKEAIVEFGRSLMENPSFWPARFYRAKLYHKIYNDKAAIRDFEKCLEQIEQYINRELYSYQILLDGFNGKYFFSMCEKWIFKLYHRLHGLSGDSH